MGLYGNVFIYENFDNLIIESNKIIFELDEFNNSNQILQEGVLQNVKSKIISAIIRIFKKIKTFFKKFLYNINFLKNAKMKKSKADDLLSILNNMQPRTLTGIITVIKNAIKDINKGVDVTKKEFNDRGYGRDTDEHVISWATNYIHEINKTKADVEECIESVKKLKEYDRFKNDDYPDDEEEINIPLNNIIKDLKNTTDTIQDFEFCLEDLEKTIDKTEKNKFDIQDFLDNLKDLVRKVIELYKMRLSFLNVFIKSSKASLKGTINNIKNSNEFKSFTGVDHGEMKTINLKNKDIEQVKDTISKLKEYGESKNFNEYIKLYDEFTDFLGLPNKCSINRIFFSTNNNKNKDELDEKHGKEELKEGTVQIKYIANDYEKINVKEKHLYHSSSYDNITELNPAVIGNKGKTFYPRPRVYANISFALDKSGKEISARNKTDNIIIYELDKSIEYAYLDPEMGKQAVFIDTDKPIKVKKLKTENNN